jgi:3-carboxy-cis,cis-muconate cycloisomerase
LSLALLFFDEGCAEQLSDDRFLAAMARFEGALALASARVGLIPAPLAQVIDKVSLHARFDARALAREGRAGTLAIPFVRQLTAQVAAVSQEAAGHVHAGATSQDVIDSAAALCLKAASERLLGLAARVGDGLVNLARKHASTITVARTLMQPAAPLPFGWKAAVWLSMFARAHAALRAAAARACVLQFGGAGGTLAAFGARGDALAAALGEELGLPPSRITWHSARDGFARLGTETAILAGAAGKMARDVALLMQPEVAEAAEPQASGRGGSSSLPHKRNPALSVLALEAAQRTPALAATLLAQLTPEHERGLGQWQSQWFTLRELFCSAGSAVAAMAEVAEGLHVDAAAMSANLERSCGLVFSESVATRLAITLGKARAHALTEKLCRVTVEQKTSLIEAMRADAEVAGAIPAAELPALFDPHTCLGTAHAMIERTIAAWTEAKSSSRETAA